LDLMKSEGTIDTLIEKSKYTLLNLKK
ncbi:Outer membrane protein TolC, partial [termite gut metagenome]